MTQPHAASPKPEDQPLPKKQEQPGLRDRWGAVQASKTGIFWLLLAAIALTMIVGFVGGGWVTSGVAERQAETSAQAAVVERLATICVAQFDQDPQKDAKLAELQDTSRYQRGTYVADQGWATMPGEDAPDNKVAAACADALMAQ